SARRPQRRRQDHPATSLRRPRASHHRQRERLRALPARPAQGDAAAHRPPRAGSSPLPRLQRRRSADLWAQLNPRWDDALPRSRIERLGIRRDGPAGKLSGGQQAQVALVLALAKRPDLLLLDEPLASLDPLARREFLGALMEAVAESSMTVLLSAHI